MRVPAFVFLALAAVCAASAYPRTATTAERIACEAKIHPKLDTIESKLRAGYSARQGESLRAQRRKLEEQRLRCRKVP